VQHRLSQQQLDVHRGSVLLGSIDGIADGIEKDFNAPFGQCLHPTDRAWVAFGAKEEIEVGNDRQVAGLPGGRSAFAGFSCCRL
jgi:hypothetical protein